MSIDRTELTISMNANGQPDHRAARSRFRGRIPRFSRDLDCRDQGDHAAFPGIVPVPA
ncbi:MAG TPA: hypothetical protein VEX86_18500 [Longimicrobium sp.]|nr:hypothetical protein [Longimicrobium sp.]